MKQVLFALAALMAEVDARASMSSPARTTTTTTSVARRYVPSSGSTIHIGGYGGYGYAYGGTVVHGKMSPAVAIGIAVGLIAFIGCIICLRLCFGASDGEVEETVITTTTTVTDNVPMGPAKPPLQFQVMHMN